MPLSWHRLRSRKAVRVYHCVGEQCSPLRDNLCRPDTSGAPRSAHPAAQRVQFAVAVQNIRASELRGTGIPRGDPLLPFGQFTLCRACVE